MVVPTVMGEKRKNYANGIVDDAETGGKWEQTPG